MTSKFKKYSCFQEDLEINESIKDSFIEFYRKIKGPVSNEYHETVDLLSLLYKIIVKKHKPSSQEKRFMRNQTLDIGKITALGAMFMIPGSSLIIPALVTLGRKYGFEILPSKNPVNESKKVKSLKYRRNGDKFYKTFEEFIGENSVNKTNMNHEDRLKDIIKREKLIKVFGSGLTSIFKPEKTEHADDYVFYRIYNPLTNRVVQIDSFQESQTKERKGAKNSDYEKIYKENKKEVVELSDEIKKFKYKKFSVIEKTINGETINFKLSKRDKSEYEKRLNNILANKAFTDNPDAVKKLKALIDSAHTGDLKSIGKHAKALKTYGINVGHFTKRPDSEDAEIQLRIGSAVIFSKNVKKTGEKTKSLERQENIIKELEKVGIDKNKASATDSTTFKAQSFLRKNPALEPQNHFENKDVREDLKKSKSSKLGKGKQVRDNISATIDSYSSENPKMTDSEKQGFKKFSEILKKENLTKAEIKKAYSDLLSSSLENASEIHKNFGELYSAIVYSIDNPESEIYFPTEGNASVSDYIVITPTGEKGYIVKRIPVKAKGKGASSSAASVPNAFIFKDTPEAKEMGALTSIWENSGSRSKSNPINDENNENTKKAKSFILKNLKHKGKTGQTLADLLIRDSKDKSYELKEPIENNSTAFLIKALLKSKEAYEVFWEKVMVPNIDLEATGKTISISEVAEDGDVINYPIDPKNCLKIKGPKKSGENVTIDLTCRVKK